LVPVAVLAAFAVATALGTSALAQVGAAGRATPGLVGLSEPAAKVTAQHAGLTLHVSHRASSDPKDVVLGQSPAPGQWLYGGDRTVDVVVSLGPPRVTVPDLFGKTPQAAAAALAKLGLAAKGAHQFRQTDPKGQIYDQNPIVGATLPPGSPVRFWWSDGPAPIHVPDVHGLSCDQAKAQLVANHLTGKCVDVYDDHAPKTTVVGTTPPLDTLVSQNTVITVNVSKGPIPVLLPDVRRKTVESAIALLKSLGFGVHVADPNFSPKAHVFNQSPAPGHEYPKGTVVTLIL
jgi:eukaryotic-like serine/threonine-protein kinase